MRHLLRSSLIGPATLLFAACASKVITQQPAEGGVADTAIAPSDEAASADTDHVGTEVPDVVSGDDAADSTATSPAASCPPISGSTPFAVRLAGTGRATDDAGVPVDDAMVGAVVDMYFPSGRVSGGEVVLALAVEAGGAQVAYGTLDSTLSARGLSIYDTDCSDGFTGDLVGPTGGIDAHVTVNLSGSWSDTPYLRRGRVAMCREGAPPEQAVDRPPPPTILPHGGFQIRGRRPFSRASFALVTAKTSAAAVPLNVTTGTPGVTIAPATRTFSFFDATTIDLSGIRDVLGGPLGLTSTTTLATTTTIVDRTFAFAPPVGSYVGDTPTISSGRLRVGFVGGDAGPGPAWQFGLAIGSAGGATKVRLRHRLECASGSSASASAMIVAADGKVAVAKPMCGTAPVDDVVTLAGVGPYALVAQQWTWASRPCNYPAPRPSGVAYELDELAFE